MSEPTGFALLRLKRQAKQERERAAAMSVDASVPRTGRRLDGFTVKKTEERDLLAIVKDLKHSEIAALEYPALADDDIWTEDKLKRCRVTAMELAGKTVRAVKQACNNLTGNFHSVRAGSTSLKDRVGWRELNMNGELVERKDPPNLPLTEVEPIAAFTARCMHSIARPTSRTVIDEEDAGKLINTMTLKPSNHLDFPDQDEKWCSLIGPLLVLGDDEDYHPYWMAALLVLGPEKLSVTGLKPLYWAYRVQDIVWNVDIREAPPSFHECLTLFQKTPWNFSHINGFRRDSVWKDFSPVPAAECLYNGLNLAGISSLTGAFPSKMVAYSRGKTWKGLAFSTPDPHSKTTVVSVASIDWITQDVDLYWNPITTLAARWKGAIALPVNDLPSIKKFMTLWGESGKYYRLYLIMGPNPHLIATNNHDAGKGVELTKMLAALDYLFSASLWLPFWNLSNSFWDEPDVWAVMFDGKFHPYYVDDPAFTSYRYVPLVTTVPEPFMTLPGDKVELDFGETETARARKTDDARMGDAADLPSPAYAPMTDFGETGQVRGPQTGFASDEGGPRKVRRTNRR